MDTVVKKQQLFFKYSFFTETQVTNSSLALHIEKAGKISGIFKSIEIKSVRGEQSL